MIIGVRDLGNLISLFAFYVLAGCYSTNSSIQGKYLIKNTPNSYYELNVKSSDSFECRWQIGLNAGLLRGIYKERNKTWLFTGGVKPPTQKIMVQESQIDNFDSIYFEIRDFEDRPIANVILLLNEEFFILADEDGKAKIHKSVDLVSMKALYLDRKIPKYKTTNKEFNHFVIKLYISSNDDYYFDNVKVKLKGNQLIMTGSPHFRNKRIRFCKVE